MKLEDPHYLRHLAELGATDIHPMGRRATVQLLSALDVEPGQRILEVGCGTGGTLIWLAQRETLHVFAVDVLPEMVKMAHRRVRRTGAPARVGLVLASGTALPFGAGFFDRVYTESVLGFQAAPAAEAMLAEIFRVLRPGGRYVANEAIWKATTSSRQVADVHAACLTDFGLSQASEQAWSEKDWLGLMTGVGLRPVSSRLLDELLEEDEIAGPTPIPEAIRNSDRLTRLHRLGRLLSPRLAWRSWLYRRRIARHREDGRLIEGRLFVLLKPDVQTQVSDLR